MRFKKLAMAFATVAAVGAISVGASAATTSITIEANSTKVVVGKVVTITTSIKNPQNAKDKCPVFACSNNGHIVYDAKNNNKVYIICKTPGKVTVTAKTREKPIKSASITIQATAVPETSRYDSTLRTNTKNSIKLIDKYLNGGKACFSTFMENAFYSVTAVKSTKLQTVQKVTVNSVSKELGMRNFYFIPAIYNAKGVSDAWYGDVYYATMLLYNAQQATLLKAGTASSQDSMKKLISTLKKVDSGLNANSSAKKVAIAFCNYVAKYGSAADKTRANKTLPYAKKLS